MRGIALVNNSSKPTIFGTSDSDEPLKSSSFNYLCSPLSKCSSFSVLNIFIGRYFDKNKFLKEISLSSSFKTKGPPKRNKNIIISLKLNKILNINIIKYF